VNEDDPQRTAVEPHLLAAPTAEGVHQRAASGSASCAAIAMCARPRTELAPEPVSVPSRAWHVRPQIN
jgi:hypothetical protein